MIVAASVLARFLLPQHGPYRFRWTIAQLVVGDLVMLSGYIGAYLFAIMENDRLTLLDFILKPIAIWGAVLREMPKTFWRAALGTWGLAMVASAFIVGGLADKDLMDWGGETAKFSLVKAITAQAQQMANNGEEGLENAIDDFAGPATANGQPVTLPKPRLSVDCLIVGFEPDGNRDFKSLILATQVDGKLACVGIVSSGIPQEAARGTQSAACASSSVPNPLCRITMSGVWVQPKLVCRITAAEWSSSKRLGRAHLSTIAGRHSVYAVSALPGAPGRVKLAVMRLANSASPSNG